MLRNPEFSCWLNRLPYILLIILVTLIGVTFILLVQQTPNTADTMGYIHAGRRLASGDGLTFEDENNIIAGQFFSPFAFQIKQPNDSRLFLGFPPGFPLLLATSIFLTGNSESTYFVVPIFAMLGLILTFLVGKRITDNLWSALLATVLVAAAPLYWQFGTDAWSEVPSLVFILAGSLFYLLSRRDEILDKEAILFSILGSILLIFSLFLRYANITFLVSIGLFELLTNPTRLIRLSKRWIFYIVLGVGLCLLLAFNHYYYGGFTLTSYSPENGWYAFPPFSLSYAFGSSPVNGFSFIASVKTLWSNFSVLLFLAPVGIYFLPKDYRLLVIFSVLSSVLLYSIYAFAAEGINGRFLIPVLPYLAIACAEAVVLAIKKIARQKALAATAIPILLLFLIWKIPPQISKVRARNMNAEKAILNLQEWVHETPSDAVFLSYVFNDQIAYFGERSVLNYRRIPQYDPIQEKYRYDLLEPCLVHAIDNLLINGKPVYYIEDGSPPLYDSKALLEQHYTLAPYRESPKVYAVLANNVPAPRDVDEACLP